MRASGRSYLFYGFVVVKRSLNIFIFIIIGHLFSCTEGQVVRSSLSAEDDLNNRPPIFSELTFGPEFEFDLPSELHEQRSEISKDWVANAYQRIKKSAADLSNASMPRDDGVIFDMGKDREFKRHFSSVVFYKPDASNNIFDLEHFRVSLVPKPSDTLFLEPIIIKYTKDDVLFEVQVSPLNMRQLNEIEPFIDRFVFESLKDAGLVIPKNGGGHIHIGMKGLTKALDEDLTRVNKTLYNFVSILLSSDDFVKTFMRPHPIFAVLPSMVSPFGRELFNKNLASWYIDFSPWQISDESLFRGYLDDLFREVSLVDYFYDLTSIQGVGKLMHFEDFSQVMVDRNAFSVPPKMFTSLYAAIRYRYHHNTLEIRALASQRKMSDFIGAARFFGGLLTGSSYLTPKLAAFKIEDDGSFLALKPNNIGINARRQALQLFDIAGINDKNEILKIITAMHPGLSICSTAQTK